MASYKKGQPANRSKAAKKKAYASRTPQARAYKQPRKVKESGTAAYSAIRLAQAALRNAGGTVKTSKGRPAKTKTTTGHYGEEVLKTRAVARNKADYNRSIKGLRKSVKRERQQSGAGMPRKYRNLEDPWSGYKASAPVKKRGTRKTKKVYESSIPSKFTPKQKKPKGRKR